MMRTIKQLREKKDASVTQPVDLRREVIPVD